MYNLFVKEWHVMKVAIGQDSHRFDFDDKDNPLILGGVVFDGQPPLSGNSDADVVLHSITNAVSGITGVNIIGKPADDMCRNGITDSKVYLEEALKYLKNDILHVSVSIECKMPKITPKINDMRKSISNILNIPETAVGITATSGEGLTQMRQR